jgi:hypothetical protein
MLRPFMIAVLAALQLGCQQEPTIPKIVPGPVTLSIAASTSTLTVGNPDTIRVIASNSLQQTAVLDFESTCTIVLTIRNEAGAAVISQSPLGCIRVPTRVSIPARGSITRTFVWTGGYELAPPDTPNKVPPGAYYASASLSARNYSTFVPAIKIDVVAR